jgi:DNA-binding winged helix-turn-helix (wHTH) protein
VKRRLLRDGEVVRLTPKAFETLLALVQERGKTIEKDELLNKVWAGVAVEENNLNQSITALRKSLGDSRQDSRYIATVPGVGYRFVADVQEVNGDENGSAVPATTPKAKTRTKERALVYGMLVVVPLVVAAVIYFLVAREKPVTGVSSIMVLPLENLSGDSSQEYFADGVTDALIGDLAKIGSLHVISRTSSMHYKGTKKLDPNHYQAWWILGHTYTANGQFDQAIEASQKAVDLSDRAPGALGMLGLAYAVAGRKDEANKVLNELLELNKRRYVTPAAFVNLYIGLGDKEQAFVWLEKAFQERTNYLAFLKVFPILDPLRSDPRYVDLVRRIGLPR